MATRQAVPDLSEQVHELPIEYLTCRDLGHDWSVPRGFFKVEVEGGVRGALYVEREVVCRCCGLPRIELFRIHARWMEKLSYHYDYSKVPGYGLRGPQKGQHVQGMVQLAIYMHEMEKVNA
jgi:hypothetical protein